MERGGRSCGLWIRLIEVGRECMLGREAQREWFNDRGMLSVTGTEMSEWHIEVEKCMIYYVMEVLER